MRLHDFVPIRDADLDCGLRIEDWFGPEFCAVDESGQLVTTLRNQNLLLRAQALLRGFEGLDADQTRRRLAELIALAEVVTQRDYDLAVRRAIRERAADRAHRWRAEDGSSGAAP
ncbi:MAG: hypothetical protein WBP72_02020 [Rhodocyclaceae bacterium]